jgi:hypothetical protein
MPITRQKSPVFSIVLLPTDSVIVDHAVSFHFFLKNLPLLFTPGAYVSRLQINKFYFYRMTFTTTTTTCSTTTSTRQLFHVLVIFLELWRNFDPKWVVGTILWPIPNSLNAITVAKRLV